VFENSPLVDLAVGRSSVRQRILTLLMDESIGRLHLREIQRRAKTSPGTASRELAKLVAVGLVDREAEGNQVFFRASSSPFASMMRSLLVALPVAEVKPRPARLPRAGSKPVMATEAYAAAPVPVVGSDAAEPGPIAGSALQLSTADASPPVADTAVDDRPADPALSGPEVLSGLENPVEYQIDAAPRVIQPVRHSPPPAPMGRTLSPAGATRAPDTSPDPVGLQVASRLGESVRLVYGGALRGIYLTGARASGIAPKDADVETIIVLERVDHYGAELEKTSHVCAALSRELDLVVSRVFVSEADWNGRADGAMAMVRAEAVAV
jgi:DNA-binding transcriptional ArsR family regulator